MGKKKSFLQEGDALIVAGILIVFVSIGVGFVIENKLPPYYIPAFIGLGLIAAGLLKRATGKK